MRAAGWRRVGTVALLIAAFAGAAPEARAQPVRPPQMLLMPLEPPPIPMDGGVLARLTHHAFELSDDRVGQLFRLTFWQSIAGRHFVRFTQDYAGLEGDDVHLWGGGRTEVQWTSNLGSQEGFLAALEAAASLSTGEEKLHPLSAGAPTLRARARVRPARVAGVDVWIGSFARMVSPPSERDREAPRSVFPSGWGGDASLHLLRDRSELLVQLRYDTGGLPRSWWGEVLADLPLSDDLALRVGGHVGMGPHEGRALDWGSTVGLSWRAPGLLSSPSPVR